MSYFLAVDGGGTKTSIICTDQNGTVVGEGLSGPTSLTATSVGAASFNLREAIRQATENLPTAWQVDKLVMGLAGMDTEEEKNKATQVFGEIISFFNIKNFELINDVKIALKAGTDSLNALAIISGTGSNCYGRNDQGAEHKVGGMDFLLTDQGSGYAIGRAVLRDAVRSFDGRSEKSILEELVKQYFKIDNLIKLKNLVYNPLLSKTEIANLAKLAFAALAQNDLVAKQTLDKAINDLYIMGSTVINKLNLNQVQTDCVLVGKIIQQDYIKNNLTPKLQSICPQLRIIVPEQKAVYGALKLAIT